MKSGLTRWFRPHPSVTRLGVPENDRIVLVRHAILPTGQKDAYGPIMVSSRVIITQRETRGFTEKQMTALKRLRTKMAVKAAQIELEIANEGAPA